MKTVEVQGKSWVTVSIEPIQALESLLNDFKYYRDWVEIDEKDGKYYIFSEDWNIVRRVKEITQEDYDYVKALELALKYQNKLRSIEFQKEN